MGHDITAYLSSADPDEPSDKFENGFAQTVLLKVAFLERGSHNPLRHTLYEVLDAQECDGNVSGIYAQRWFSRERLETGLARLSQRLAEGLQVQCEIDFVRACLAELPQIVNTCAYPSSSCYA